MTFISMARAAGRRTQVVRGGAEGGFVMIYVLMISTIVTVLVSATLVVSSGAVIPAVRGGYNQAAYAAAQGGLAAFVSYADVQCKDAQSSVATCTLPTNGQFDVPIYSASGYTAKYTWEAAKDPQGGRYFRVRATGTVSQGGLTVKKTLVADVAGGASNNLLDYGVVTGFETQSPDLILSDFPRRAISIDSAAATAAGVAVKGGMITWSGASPGVAAGKLAVCNSTYSGAHGRSTNPPPGAPNHYVDWSENGLEGNNYTHYQSCQTTFGHSTKLLAPVNPADGAGGYFSQDALLLSNSFPGGTGPLFNQPVTTLYHYSSADGPCGTVGQNYRSFNLICDGYPVDVGGTPAPASIYGVQAVPVGPTIPTNSPEISATACVYAGPTRVKLNSDGSATVTSPQTTQTWVNANAASRPPQCYAGANGAGMSAASISLTAPLTIRFIYVQNHGTPPPTTPALAHGSSGWDTTGQKLGDTASTANSVFYLTSGTPSTSTVAYATTSADKPYSPATGDNPATKADGAWTPQWTSFSAGSTCSSSTVVTDLKFFNCYVNSGSYSAAAYPNLKATVQAALAANPGNFTTASTLQAYLAGVLAVGNSADSALTKPTHTDNTSHRWQVSVASDASATDGCTPATGASTTTNTPVAAPSDDPFFASSSGNSAVTVHTDTTCFTATVTAQVGTCSVALLAGVCINLNNYVWGNGAALLGGGLSIAQFKSTFTVAKTSTDTINTAGVSSFPSMEDVTQHEIGGNGSNGSDGPGDLYIEGTSANSLALIAQNDVIVTNSLTATDTTSQALEIIANNDVRIHHPVKCAVTGAAAIATTDAGNCPNDITGLYDKVLPSGTRPDQQYTDLRPDLHDLTIHGVIFALGIPQSSVTCPQPPQGGGVCGGEFTVDNYSRGDSVGTTTLGTLLIVGTVAMAHHGPVGQEWEIADAVGQTSRPYSGYQFAEQYQNLKNAISTLNQQAGVTGPQTTSTTSSLWHVVSVSTGSGS